MDEAYFDWVGGSSNYLGKTSTLSPAVTIDMLNFGWDPVDVCGYLCTTNAPNHATRGVCKQFYTDIYELENPVGTIVSRTASCTFMNELAVPVYNLPANSAWEAIGVARQRYIYDAYSVNHPPSPPFAPPPLAP